MSKKTISYFLGILTLGLISQVSYAAASGDIFHAIDKGKIPVLRSYLNARGDPNLTDYKGRSLLARAAYREQFEMTRDLLEAGASVDLADHQGNTPLYMASSSGNVDIVRLFIPRSKNLNYGDERGVTALHIASKKGHTAVVESLCQAGALRDLKTREEKTALWLASCEGYFLTVGCLLSHNAQVDLADQHGVTPLLIGSYCGHTGVVRSLLARGSDVDRVRDNGISPLIIASYQGHEEVVHLLAEANADVMYRSPSELGGGTAFQYALSQGHETISHYLQALLAERKAQATARELAHSYQQLESLRDMVRQLTQKMTKIEEKEQQQESELDHVKRTQDQLSKKQQQLAQASPISPTSVAFETDLKKLQQQLHDLEKQDGIKEDKLAAMQQEHAALMKDHRLKEEIEAQKRELKAHPNLKVFYETVDRTLNQLFLAYKVLDTGMVQKTSSGKSAMLASGINLLGSAIPLPFASLVTSAISSGITYLNDRSEKRHVRFIAKLVMNTATIDAESEKAARFLSHTYRDQLIHLSVKGSQTLAECGVVRFIEFMRGERVSDEMDLAPQLVSSVVLVNLHQGSFPFTHKSIETVPAKTPVWTEKGIYQKTGIITKRGYRFAHPTYRGEYHHYGFRQGTEEDAEAFGYQNIS